MENGGLLFSLARQTADYVRSDDKEKPKDLEAVSKLERGPSPSGRGRREARGARAR